MALEGLDAGQQQLLAQQVERLGLAADGKGLQPQMDAGAIDAAEVDPLG